MTPVPLSEPDPTSAPPPVRPAVASERLRAGGVAGGVAGGAASVPVCHECGAPVAGAFCATCGQKAGSLRQPVHVFVRASVSEFFGLDGRVWRTFAALLAAPGTLTHAYNAGQRQRYLTPLRVYLTSTLLFFFLLSYIDPVGRIGAQMNGGSRDSTDAVSVRAHLVENDSVVAAGFAGGLLSAATAGRRAAVVGDSVRAFSAEANDTVSVSAASLRDSLLAARDGFDPEKLVRARLRLKRARAESAILRTMPPDSLIYPADVHDATAVLYPDTVGFVSSGPEWFARSETIRQIQNGQTESSKTSALMAFVRSAIGYVPTVMFLLLPLFALFMKALYARRGWFYSEHIVFGLHTHAYAFVVFAAISVVTWVGQSSTWSWWAVLLLSLSIPIYFFIAQKRVYGQSWKKTIVKAVLLGGAYTTALLFGLIGAVVLAALIG